MKYKALISSILILFGGGICAQAFGKAHPSGFENRKFFEKRFVIQGEQKSLGVEFLHPKPTDSFDLLRANSKVNGKPYWTPLSLHFEYRGLFWQGTFGAAVISFDLIKRSSDELPWVGLAELLSSLKRRTEKKRTWSRDDISSSKQHWSEPAVVDLNGMQCIRQDRFGSGVSTQTNFYFLFENNYAMNVRVELVDNSNRPGLPSSDWFPRAQGLANEIIATLKVSLSENESK